ncbi:hypothetical protein SAMN05428975_1093 [Mucilaginibacter sp. OK268]|uniref:hypothetical protein n=1 Tax=Mucilaginibacter sp. OK268 TaxID=1881048 RepID=UPI00087F58AC|nr:hypothetical protein [Mucilaginibacter sp. OK268]SDP30882.1 hypothetical protein SAMN05428975_1093 [Mucilaginibacter sp. OK268]
MQKILFITGSVNQTSQMHQIANELPEFDCWFSQLFTDSYILNLFINHTSLLNGTILSNYYRTNSEKYLHQHGLQIDYGARLNHYDLVVFCSDILVPRRMRKTKTVWVQEGMVDKYTLVSKLVKMLKLPTFLCGNTSLNGSSNVCDVYCSASLGYRQYFIKNGTHSNKIAVTGMPNYDNLEQFLDNDFPHRDYVMVATTDMRETYRFENRPAFIKSAVKIANGRPLLFKLHPNENAERAEKEIRKHAPVDAMIFKSGNTNHMIANCCELITQYSTVVYTGIALGKKVHSWFDVDELKKLAPIQNGGISAQKIAQVCRAYTKHKGMSENFDVQKALNTPGVPFYTEQLVANY